MIRIDPTAVLSQKTAQIENRINAKLYHTGINIRFSSFLTDAFAGMENNKSEPKKRRADAAKKASSSKSSSYNPALGLLSDIFTAKSAALYSQQDGAAGKEISRALEKYMTYNILAKNYDFLSEDVQSELKRIESEQIMSDTAALIPAAAIMTALL